MQQVCGKMSEVLKQRIRRDLSRWSRKLLLCIGLEGIGRELVGEKEWQKLYPLKPDWEQDSTSDFNPNEVPEDNFYVADYPHADPSETPEPEEDTTEEKNEVVENFFHLLPYWYFVNRAFQVPGDGTQSSSVDLSNGNPVSEAFAAQQFNCLLFLQSLKNQQLQFGVTDGVDQAYHNIQNLSFPSTLNADELDASTAGRFPNNNALSRNLPFSVPGLSLEYPSQDEIDQPLDLTQKSLKLNESCEGQHPRCRSSNEEPGDTSPEDNKSTQFRSSRTISIRSQRCGRGYTAQELEAALKDIQSGKLGTRRAAVIYGIPRSTLRNKVYKLGKDRNRSYFRKPLGSEDIEDIQNLTSQKSLLPHGLTENSVAKIKIPNYDLRTKLSLLPETYSSIPNNPNCTNFDGAGIEDDVGVKEGDSKLDSDEISHEKKMLKEWLRSKLTRQGLNQKKFVNECLIGRRRSLTSRKHLPSDSSDNSDGSKEEFSREVILNVPSLLNKKSSLSRLISKKQKLKRKAGIDEPDSTYMPTVSRRSYSSASTSTRTGSERQVQKFVKHEYFEENSMDEFEGDSTAADTKSQERNYFNTERIVTRYRSASTVPRNCLPPCTDSNGKKSRPKRGKYRNYDRDALLKAVRAVQNGEMSVHRAGSFFGVPHSTLEYKVKERHLLRRNKKENCISKLIQKSSPESSLSGSDIPPSHQPTNAGLDSNSRLADSGSANLALPSDFRETLSRYLNIDQPFRLHSHSEPTSPDVLLKSSTEENRYSKEDVEDGGIGHTNHSLNIFQFGNHHRHNNPSSLLDLSKKGE